MIELSGYTGKSANSVRDRLLASKEMKTNKPTTQKKYTVRYSIQTLVMGKGFSIIADGLTDPVCVETEVSSIEDFEAYVVSSMSKKHKNPQQMKNDKKHTIFSYASDDLMYVDIVDFKGN